MKPIDPPFTGGWGLPGYPDVITVDIGATRHQFRKARWKKPYAGVVEQYREDVPRGSMHLFIFANGTFAIDHVDDDNPDHGRVIEHAMNDTPVGGVVKAAAVVGGIALIGGAVVSMLSE